MQQLFSKSSDWIWMDNAPDVNCYVEFFDTFETVSSEKIELLISVEGQYGESDDSGLRGDNLATKDGGGSSGGH